MAREYTMAFCRKIRKIPSFRGPDPRGWGGPSCNHKRGELKKKKNTEIWTVNSPMAQGTHMLAGFQPLCQRSTRRRLISPSAQRSRSRPREPTRGSADPCASPLGCWTVAVQDQLRQVHPSGHSTTTGQAKFGHKEIGRVSTPNPQGFFFRK